MRILMCAAENGALPGVKVGGIADVVRDVPKALARQGCEVDIVTPGYGLFANLDGSKLTKRVVVTFAGSIEHVELFNVAANDAVDGVRHWVMEHPLFTGNRPGQVYVNDKPTTPFATDATKFALFNAAVCEALQESLFGIVDVLHLHDWHTALILALHQFSPRYESLRAMRYVYTIHNLALQGVRPFANHPSSLESWFPDMTYDTRLLADPRWPECVNPMAVGIRMADAVHTVSPSYAQEICLSSDIEKTGVYGGEGLERDLQNKRDQGRLHGILNGCEYPDAYQAQVDWSALHVAMKKQVRKWVGEGQPGSVHHIAEKRLNALTDNRPGFILSSVGRVTAQKLQLLRETTSHGHSALDGILRHLSGKGIFILLGNGDPEYEQFLQQCSVRHNNFIFLSGYAESLSSMLYANGDLFLMPSSYEPCGISQLLAMRAGQPCLVHHVGGLKDTVEEKISGFTFDGEYRKDQADRLEAAFERAFQQFDQHPEKWRKLRASTMAQRFTWDKTVQAYLTQLYA